MTSFIVNSQSSILQTLNASETGLVGRDGILAVAGASAVVMAPNGATLSVLGTILNTLPPLFEGAVQMSGYGIITAGEGSFISGSYAGINGSGGASLFMNGSVFGGSVAVQVMGLSVVIDNGGQIASAGSAGVNVGATFEFHLSNTGTITGGYNGIYSSSTGTELIENDGRIEGAIYAISLGDNVSTVDNRGTLIGKVNLGGGNDIFRGQQGIQSEVLGYGGNDRVTGGVSDELLDGGDGKDILSGRGGEDRLIGGLLDDRLYGGADDDRIYGGGGKDIIYGGAGDDWLTGGADAVPGTKERDTFVFTRGFGQDTVSGFVDNSDRLDLRAFDIASFAALKQHASNSKLGLHIDLTDEGGGVIILTGFNLAHFTAQDVLI